MRSLLLAATILAGTFAPLPAAALDSAPARTTAAAIPPEAGPMPAGRLDGSVRPSAYRLDLTVDPAKEGFSGHVEIDAALQKASPTVWLHGRNLTVGKVTASVGGRAIAGSYREVDPTGVALLTFPEALPAGPVTFAFDYDGVFQDSPTGLFRVKVGDDWYSWSQFESIDARSAFPSFDEPGFKVPFTVTLRTPAGLKAVSNAPEIATETAGGMTVHRFAPTLPLPSYLVAVMVGPFVTAEGTVPPTPQRATPLPLRVVSTRQNADRLAFALEGSKGIVQHLESYFGQAFPYPKLDQITSPIMPGAMENAGADLYADPILVMGEDAPVSDKRTFGMVVAHELAHQWFGDLVTPAWWDDIWLNESFANWMGYRIGNEWRPDLNIGAGALEEGFGAMNTDALVAGRPIHQPIPRNDQIDSAFDTSADFFGAMAEAAGDPRILPAMQSFTDQQGVPLVTFSRGPRPGEWQVAQSRYARLGTSAPATTWGIPLCVRHGTERQCQLLTGPGGTVRLSGKGALMPNAGGTGYYRFELPAREWDALIATAATLPGGEALAFQDSLSASFLAGRASPEQLIAGSRALAANPDSYASGNATSLLETMAMRGVIGETAMPQFRALIDGLYAPQLKAIGFDPRAGAHAADDAERQQRRTQLVDTLAGTARDSALRAQLAKAADAYIAGDAAALDPAFMRPAFKAWLVDGGVAQDSLERARRLLDKALASEDPTFRPAALGALGASGRPEIAAALHAVQDKRLRVSEQLNLLLGIIATPETRDQGYAWLKQNLETIFAGNGGIFFISRLPQVLGGFCAADKASDFETLRPRFAGTPGALELERAIERVRSCARLKDARAAELTAAVAKIR